MSELKLLAVGDISLQTTENPFRQVTVVFSSKDILFGNLETSLTDCWSEARKAISISSKPWKVKFLREAGFDILNLANNHILDRGHQGLVDTLNNLDRTNIAVIGAGVFGRESSAVIYRNDLAIGFLGYDQYGYNENGHTINRISLDKITADIVKLKLQCDIIIISLHWGIENVYYPSPEQISLAHSIIDAGATIILGHHPHVLQGIEKYHGGIIAYSLGNFQFDHSITGAPQTTGRRSDQSIILSLGIGKKGLISHEIIPVIINDRYEPQPFDKHTDIRAFMDRISEAITAKAFDRKWWCDQVARQYISDSMKSWKLRISLYGPTQFMRFCRWLVTPFVLRCFKSIIRQSLPSGRPRAEFDTVSSLPEQAGVGKNVEMQAEANV